MEAKIYQTRAQETSRINWGETNSTDILVLGLIGEVGSLATVLKKHLRDKDAYLNYQVHILEELGDILWYVTTSASRLDLLFENWPLASKEQKDVFPALYELNEKVTKFSEIKTVLVNPDNNTNDEASGLIQDIVQDLACIAAIFDTTLNEVAARNSEKTISYWCGRQSSPAPHFDAGFPWYEQLPRQFHVDFLETKNNKELILIMNGRQLGDRLTDNSYLDDGYRFHDIFHLAGVAMLGWSPVFRELLSVKRKSDPKVDEIEDGARAAIVEEAVINHIYDYARPNFLEGISRVELDLIKRIKDLVRGYEVSNCELWEWNDCIIKSYEMFRLLIKNGGGRIEVDADKRSMIFHQKSQGMN